MSFNSTPMIHQLRTDFEQLLTLVTGPEAHSGVGHGPPGVCEATHAVQCSRLSAYQRTLSIVQETAAHAQRFALVGRQTSSQTALLAVTAEQLLHFAFSHSRY
jgi:hypothetical protein